MKNARYLTEGALLLALFITLLVCSIYIPLLGTIFSLALSVPFLIFTVRHGWEKALIFFIISLLLSLLFGTVFSLPVTWTFGTSGIVIGHLYKQKKGRYTILLAGTVIFSLNLVMQYVIANVLFNINMLSEIKRALDESIATTSEMLKGMGQSPNEGQIKQMELMFDLIQYLFPSLIVMSSFFLAFMTQFIAAPVLRRLRYEIESFPPFRELVLPKSILWYYLLAMVLSFLNLEEGSFLFVVLLNIVTVLQILMIVQGYSLIFYYCHKKSVGRGLSIVIVVLSLFLLQIVRILGIIDLGFNLRNIKQSR